MDDKEELTQIGEKKLGCLTNFIHKKDKISKGQILIYWLKLQFEVYQWAASFQRYLPVKFSLTIFLARLTYLLGSLACRIYLSAQQTFNFFDTLLIFCERCFAMTWKPRVDCFLVFFNASN